jgi:hypothetical protein
LISEQDYWAAQSRLQGKGINVQAKEEVPLRGVLRCPECGALMTAGNSKGRKKYYWYYLCNVHRKNFPANKLHAQLNEILDLFSFSEPVLEHFKKKLSEEITAHLGQRGELLAAATKSLRSVQDKIASVEEKYLMGETSKASYTKVISRLRGQQVELERNLYDLQSDQQQYWDRLTALLPKLYDIRGTYETLTLVRKQQLLNMVFDNSVTHDGEVYRTAFLDPIFQHNALILKEKRLLIVEQPFKENSEIPKRALLRSSIEPASLFDQFNRLADLLAA